MDSSLFVPRTCFIDGQHYLSTNKQCLPVHNPFNQELITEVADCDKNDASYAIDAATSAQKTWQTKPAKARAQLLRKWFELVMTHQAELATILTLEQGKPFTESEGEVAYGASFIEWFAEEAKRIAGNIFESPKAGQKILVSKSPVGVCLLVTPWNFPIAMITRKAAPALAAGCSVIIKPAEDTPLSALALAALAHQAGIPPGVINVVTTSQPAGLVEHMMADSRIKKISFTGSTSVGKQLMRQAATNLQRVSLELGGNAPFIVFDDADLDSAICGAIASKFRNAGQTCVCTNRFLVHHSIADKFANKLAEEAMKLTMGYGMNSDVLQGPLINESAVKKVESHIANAIDLGATILCGGSRVNKESTLFHPTVLTHATSDMQLCHEETFGPLAAILTFDSEEQAITMANDTCFGLAAYVYTENLGTAMRVSAALEYGMVGVNEGIISNEVGPFGGVKESGMGREGSVYGIEEYLETKYTLLGGL